MPSPPRAPGRRSIRLPGYDYAAPGAYFLTICVHGRRRLFGHVARRRLCTNAAGAMVRAAWDVLPERFPDVAVDAFVVMPDHVHGILWITGDGARRGDGAAGDGGAPTKGAPTGPGGGPPGDVRAPLVGARRDPMIAGARGGRPRGIHAPPTLGDIIGAFKSLTTVAYFHGVRTAGWPRVDGRLWHRNYYERILRDGEALGAVRRYIARNPACWVAKYRRSA